MRLPSLLLLLFTCTANAQLSVCDSGSWSIPDAAEGISLEVNEGAFYAYFYTHDRFNQAWLLMIGDPETGAADIYDSLSDGYSSTAHRVGSARLSTDSGRLLFSWELDFDFGRDDGGIPWCLSGCDGAISLDRLTSGCA